MKRIFVALLTVLVFAACSPKPEQLQVLVEQTVAAIPTQTAYPTYTPNPTYTREPTYTPEPTYTAVVITKIVTPTNTATATLTPTPIHTPTPTKPPTATFSNWQLTNVAYKATNSFMASFESVPWKDFVTYPDKYKGKEVRISCRIFNVADSNDVQCYITATYEAVYVTMLESFDSLYEDDRITVYGIGAGSKCFTNTMGNLTCQPLIDEAFYTKP
jgi:hypothetical protein